MYEIRTEGGALAAFIGSYQGFLTWGGDALAVIYPGGHLPLLGLKAYNGFVRRRKKVLP